MKNPLTKLAAAAAVVAVLWLGIHLTGRSSVAWAEVVQNIQNARTLIYQTINILEDGQRQVLTVMVYDADRMRAEVPDGRIWIVDLRQGQTLVLNPDDKRALLSTTPQQTFDVYDAFRDFRNLPDYSVRRVGRRTFDGMAAEGFELTKAGEDHPITVWADPRTSLPVRIEQTVQTSDGQLVEIATTNIVFDAELDESLFSLEVPAGYAPQFMDGPAERAAKLGLRVKTATKMKEIMRACLAYVQEHDGQWPDSLQALAPYGLANDALVNPRQPDLEIGYVYVRPDTTASPQQIVLYERYDSWNAGVNVGFVDGHIEFIADEASLNARLE